ncbi:glycine cleavage system H protein, mitochondrial-like [Curcuma longa]|uniref:glycine cleavage system H protein, mitochondrial-like n=1 Tax=Curcuma longa TaxID=136217 RepID=UPI003D9F54EA
MALKLWASSAASALKFSCRDTATAFPASSFTRCFSSVIDGFKYSNSHEWVKHEDAVATIGITDHAQGHLGDVVFVELPESGAAVTKGQRFGSVESVKASSDVNSPVSGEVTEVNTKLTGTPGLINSSPYEDGWMVKVKPSDPSELESLMGSEEYTKFCKEEDAH